MSFVITAPEFLAVAAADFAEIGSTIKADKAAAAASATGVIPAAADEVSAGIAALFGAHAQTYQAISAQAVAFHDQFVQTLNTAAEFHASTEAVNSAPLAPLIATNIFGQNTPAIAATEAQYMEMWAQDLAGMVGYHAGANINILGIAPQHFEMHA